MSLLKNFKHSMFCMVIFMACFGSAVASAGLEKMTFFRIGTGGVGGSYYPIGGIIANAISKPPGSRPCNKGGSCGVKNLVAIAQSSEGSIANVNGIENGTIDAGFVQSDVAYWAYTATGPFKGRPPARKLRAIAALYPETVHLVVARDSGISNVLDLKGKIVSIDRPGSGTIVDARLILKAAGLDENKDIYPQYFKAGPSAERLRNGGIDAYFFVAGAPVSTIIAATATGNASIANIDGKVRQKLLRENLFFAKDVIPKGTYKGVGKVDTVSVKALLLVSADVSEKTVYAITKALWNKSTKTLLHRDAKGRHITLATALYGVSIPLHKGAERFYKEVGMIK